MASAELRALLLLRLLPGVGDRRTAALRRELGSARAALQAPADAFARWAGRRGAEARRDRTLRRRVDEILAFCRERGIRVVGIGEPLYPPRLEHLTDPPPVLFLRGDPALLRIPSVTIVGSRKATSLGRRTARTLAAEISARDVPVVSGLALGIDGAAHRGALTGPGGTVAVLGAGPDRAYPPGNRKLFRRIVEEGLVVSEFPPGEEAQPHHFPRRNRILAALAHVVVVVEAAGRSGALITVDHALDLGREIFAVPGALDAPQSRGTNELLADGAGAVTGVRHLENALRRAWRNWALEPGLLPVRWEKGGGSAAARDPAQDRPAPRAGGGVRSFLGPDPLSLETLVARAGLPPGRVLALLTEMEVRGEARREGGGWRLERT